MPRTDSDTWDLASKQPDPLIADPFADPLAKAVGVEHCNRMADDELTALAADSGYLFATLT